MSTEMIYENIDLILSVFLTTLDSGFAALQRYTLPLLAIFALTAYCTNLWGDLLRGGSGMASVMTQLVSIGLWYWVSIGLGAMALAAFDTFTQWGASVGILGSPASFLIPSQVWKLGWDSAQPLFRLAMSYQGWAVLWNIFTIGILWLSAMGIVLAYGFMAFFVMLVQIEFRLGIMLAAVLVPLGIYQGTAFMAEFGLGVLCGGLVRTFMTTALLAISAPLVRLMIPQLGGNGEPTLETAIVMAFVSAAYVALLIVGSRRASTMAVRGLGLGLGAGGGGLNWLLATTGSVIRGSSRLIMGGRQT